MVQSRAAPRSDCVMHPTPANMACHQGLTDLENIKFLFILECGELINYDDGDGKSVNNNYSISIQFKIMFYLDSTYMKLHIYIGSEIINKNKMKI